VKSLAAIALAVGALLAGNGCGGAKASEQTVVISIHHSSFTPSEVTVAAGSTVTFVVRNGDPIDHEFIIGDRHVQRIHELGTEAHHGAKPGEISIPAGTERTTTYTFSGGGTLIFGCHVPSHYKYGMRGLISITS
jgi:uncharacterized cupredoxin-like copper-binding protein